MLLYRLVGSCDIAFFVTLRLHTTLLGLVSPRTHREILTYFGQN